MGDNKNPEEKTAWCEKCDCFTPSYTRESTAKNGRKRRFRYCSNCTDPNKPDPGIPWCKECRNYTYWVARSSTDSKGITYVHKHCEICDSPMMSPNSYFLLSFGLGIFTVVCAWASYATIGLHEGERINWGAILVGIPLFGLGTIVCGGVTLYLSNFYISWLMWRKEYKHIKQ